MADDGGSMKKILAIDISSTACGWATLTAWPPKVRAFGVFRPKGKTSIDRIRRIAGEVESLVLAHGPDRTVAEWSSGKVHARIKGRTPSGLAVLGQAQGYVVGRLEQSGAVELVGENDWTRGCRKSTRAASLELTCPEYAARAFKDSGFDACDAISLGLWWLHQDRARELELSAVGDRHTCTPRRANGPAPGYGRSDRRTCE